MDSDGHQVIPFDYDNIVPYIVDDKYMAIKDKQLYILSSTGVPLRIIKGDFIEIRAVTRIILLWYSTVISNKFMILTATS